MPVKPENKHRYPKNWKQISERILARAGHKCEQCGVKNYAFRNKRTGEVSDDGTQIEAWELADGDKVTKIVLTIAHLDHVPENCSDDNLRAWCQKCHLAYDHEHHQRNAHVTRQSRKAASDLFVSAERIKEIE